MYSRDYRDLAGGLLLTGVGGFMAWHAYASLGMGTLARLGSGAFPIGIGALLIGFGIAIALPALFRQGALDAVELRSALACIGSVIAFGLLIVPFGIVPAIIGLLVVASLAEQKFRPLALLAMSVVLPLLVYLTFKVALGLPMTMIRWPF